MARASRRCTRVGGVFWRVLSRRRLPAFRARPCVLGSARVLVPATLRWGQSLKRCFQSQGCSLARPGQRDCLDLPQAARIDVCTVRRVNASGAVRALHSLRGGYLLFLPQGGCHGPGCELVVANAGLTPIAVIVNRGCALHRSGLAFASGS
jgi:hypothetical protein